MKIIGILCIVLFVFSGMAPVAFAGDKIDVLLNDLQDMVAKLTVLKAKEGAGSENIMNLKMEKLPLLQELSEVEGTMSPKQKQRYDALNKKLGEF